MNWHLPEPCLQLFAEIDVILAKRRRRWRRRLRRLRLRSLEARAQDDSRVVRVERRESQWWRRSFSRTSRISSSIGRFWKIGMRRRPGNRVQVDGGLVDHVRADLRGQADQRPDLFELWHFESQEGVLKDKSQIIHNWWITTNINWWQTLFYILASQTIKLA